jgi:hypothetical protein
VLRAVGETETTQDWLEFVEGDPKISASDKGRKCCSDIFLFIFISTIYTIKFSIYWFYTVTD